MFQYLIVCLYCLSILWPLSVLGQNPPADHETLSVSFDEEFMIGKDGKVLEAFLGRPREVRTDEDGNIYISDRQTSTVKVFDRDGKYLREIGKQGKGPGEFLNIPTIEITWQNELLTFEGDNRHVNLFSIDGERLSTHVPDKNMVWPSYVRQIKEDRYLVLRKLWGWMELTSDEERNRHTSFLHLIDSEFERQSPSFGHFDLVMNSDDEFTRLFASEIPGHFWPSEEGGIWFVPGIYEGRLFRFLEGPEGWRLDRTITGHLITSEVITVAKTNAVGHPSFEGAIGMTIFTPKRKSVAGRINSYSLGIFELQDGRLLHFNSQLLDEERMTMVELFNQNGELEGVGRLNGFTAPATSHNSGIGSLWKDQEDRFYLIDLQGDVPLVRVGRIQGI